MKVQSSLFVQELFKYHTYYFYFLYNFLKSTLNLHFIKNKEALPKIQIESKRAYRRD
jgi:hypothetical protein